MLSKRLVFVGALRAALLVCAAAGSGQTTVNPNAKACQLLSVPELEAHFGGKAISVRGSDTSTVSMCSVRVKDMRHEATAQLNAPSPASQALTPQQRLEFFANGGIKLSETKVFGSIGCFKTSAPLDKPLPSTGCFLSDAKGYTAVTIASDDSKQTSYEVVKALLEKSAARRK